MQWTRLYLLCFKGNYNFFVHLFLFFFEDHFFLCNVIICVDYRHKKKISSGVYLKSKNTFLYDLSLWIITTSFIHEHYTNDHKQKKKIDHKKNHIHRILHRGNDRAITLFIFCRQIADPLVGCIAINKKKKRNTAWNEVWSHIWSFTPINIL